MSTTAAKRVRSPHQPVGCWIRPEKRAAIYHRDGWRCVYCGSSVKGRLEEAPAVLTLDHLTPKSEGGSNDPSNLVTACRPCNSSRGTRPWKRFAPGGAVARIQRLTAKPLDMETGRAVVASLAGDPTVEGR